MQKLLLTIVFLIVGYCSALAQNKGYDVISYTSEITLDRQQNHIKGRVDMAARSSGQLTDILQHLKGLTIDSIFVGSSKASFSTPDSVGEYHITNFPDIADGLNFTVRTFYHGNPTTEGGANPWGGVTNNGKMMFAMGVGFSAPYVSCTRHWLPCYDLPDDKAETVTMTFTCAYSDIVASNGYLEREIHDAATDQRIALWKVSHPIATYLLTFAVGPFVKQEIPNPLQIPIQCYSDPADSAKLSVLMYKRVVRALEFFDSLYGPYPFEKVGYVVAPIGSMEHQTMITLVNLALDTNSTTAEHELAHMWWGDWVTCDDFNDPWLNEGFAMFSESLILERFKGTSFYWSRQRSNITAAINKGSLIPIYGAPYHTNPRDNYPYAVIYQKAAAVLGMLRYILGDSVFFEAVRSYGKAHAYSTATTPDLQRSFELNSGQDLDWFFKQWIYGIWYPQIKLSWGKEQNNSYRVVFTQTQDASKYQYFRMPFVIEARTKSGQKERAIGLMDSTAISTAYIQCSFPPDTIVIDPDGAVIKKIVGPVVLLGVKETPTTIQYGMHFTPNPVASDKVILAISALPHVHDALLEEDYYLSKRLNSLITSHGYLMIFDSNGRQVLSQELTHPEIVSISDSPSYRYPISIASLSSGTYFAKLLLEDNLLVGEGEFIVTK